MIRFPKHNASLWITHNEHTTNYESIAEYLVDVPIEELSVKEKQLCIDTNSIWEMQVYDKTPVGFYKIYSPTFMGLLMKDDEEGYYDG